jgi:hypothetical protein
MGRFKDNVDALGEEDRNIFSKGFDIVIRRKYKPQYEALLALSEAYGVCIISPQSSTSEH